MIDFFGCTTQKHCYGTKKVAFGMKEEESDPLLKKRLGRSFVVSGGVEVEEEEERHSSEPQKANLASSAHLPPLANTKLDHLAQSFSSSIYLF